MRTLMMTWIYSLDLYETVIYRKIDFFEVYQISPVCLVEVMSFTMKWMYTK